MDQPPCPADIPMFLHTRPGKTKEEYEAWRAEYEKVPQTLRDRYNAWLHECGMAAKTTRDAVWVGYRMMQAMEPERHPSAFVDVPEEKMLAMKEAALRIAASLYRNGVSRDVVATGSPLPQSFCFAVAGFYGAVTGV